MGRSAQEQSLAREQEVRDRAAEQRSPSSFVNERLLALWLASKPLNDDRLDPESGDAGGEPLP